MSTTRKDSPLYGTQCEDCRFFVKSYCEGNRFGRCTKCGRTTFVKYGCKLFVHK